LIIEEDVLGVVVSLVNQKQLAAFFALLDPCCMIVLDSHRRALFQSFDDLHVLVDKLLIHGDGAFLDLS
jgi:hypothetical protein